MSIKAVVCASVLLAGAALGCAHAADTADTTDAAYARDVRCLVVALQAAKLDDPKAKAAAPMLTIYYLGRLDARAPNGNLEELIVKELSTWTTTDFSTEAARCGGEVQRSGQRLTIIGQHLVERGQKMQDQAQSDPTSPPSK